MSQSQRGTGIKIAYNGYVLLETTEVTPAKFSRAKDDGTSHDSTAKVHEPGWPEWSDLTFTCFAIDDAAQALMETLRDSGAKGTWKVIRPATWKAGGVTTPFKTDKVYGWISGWEPVLPLTGRATYKLTITPEETVTTGITTLGAALTTPFFALTNQAGEAISAITPSASATAYKYAVTAFSDDTGIKITPTATTGTIYVNGAAVTSGAASGTITLNLGGITTFYVMVVESDLKCSPIYQFDVTIGTVASPT